MRLAKCCDPSAPRVYKIKLDTGTVGILGLDLIMAEVRSMEHMEPLSEEEAKKVLLQRLAANNYIPGSARDKYAEALYREYVKQIE